MKKSLLLVSMFALVWSMGAVAAAPVQSDPPPVFKLNAPVETTFSKPAQQPLKKAPGKKAVIEMCDCYEQVKPPCRKEPDTPRCPRG